MPQDSATSAPYVILVEAALYYASIGFYVFPCHGMTGSPLRCTCGSMECKPGKHPRTSKGHLDATVDPVKIKQWWKRYPDANVAIATGKASNLCVIDKDVGPGKFSAESMDVLQDRLGKLPPTDEQITGSGGSQLLYRYPAGGQCIRSRRGYASGIDIRAEGGYIIAPPSMHESGSPYVWEASSGLDTIPIAELPPSWIEALCDRCSGAEYVGEPPDLDHLPTVEKRVQRAQ
jgi:putative DNA primase/helicase